MTKSEKTTNRIDEIIDRDIAACFPNSRDIHPELRLFGAILAKGIVEECAKMLSDDIGETVTRHVR